MYPLLATLTRRLPVLSDAELTCLEHALYIARVGKPRYPDIILVGKPRCPDNLQNSELFGVFWPAVSNIKTNPKGKCQGGFYVEDLETWQGENLILRELVSRLARLTT